MYGVKSILACLAIALSAIACTAATNNGVLRTASLTIPADWTNSGNSASSTPFNFTLHLFGHDMKGLTARMEQIASQGNGRWLTENELRVYVSPCEVVMEEIITFLESHNIPRSAMQVSKFRERITVISTVGQVATVFSATFRDYTYSGLSNTFRIPRTREYTIPAGISDYVYNVSPLALFGQVQSEGGITEGTLPTELLRKHASLATQAALPASCNISAVTPQCRKEYYGTASYQRSKGGAKPDVSIIGSRSNNLNELVLGALLERFAPEAKDYTIPIQSWNGAVNNQDRPGFESLLNAGTVVAEIFPLTSTFILMSKQETTEDEWLLTYTTLLDHYTEADRPKIITMSYSGDERYFTPSQAKATCEAAQMLTALGTTVVMSSGDHGVSGSSDGETCPSFVPRYPSGCPYVLSVGATQGFAPEVVMEENLSFFDSGAGASNIFPMPKYQKHKVKTYQKSIPDLQPYYNQSGRMYPDLAALGSRFVTYSRGRLTTGSGTSASAPLTASILALVNDKREKKGMGTIGWANPAIWATSLLHDVREGGSYNCGSTKLGFPTRPGYDAPTGNGTPMFDAISKVFGV